MFLRNIAFQMKWVGLLLFTCNMFKLSLCYLQTGTKLVAAVVPNLLINWRFSSWLLVVQLMIYIEGEKSSSLNAVHLLFFTIQI